MDRRNSKDGQPPRSPPNPDVFDDEYALDPDEEDFMPSVSDGFRPVNTSNANPIDARDIRSNHGQEAPRPQTTPTKAPEGTDLRRTATRNSTAKVPFGRESLSLDSRSRAVHQRGPSSQATPLQHRTSVSSTASFATTTISDGPFGTGPSHPYGMYPQTTVVRSTSSATNSAQHPPPPRPLGPSHPYGMYHQNIVEDEPPMPPVQTTIPVGFPGISTGFHRQIGPDGEEQDIIGPFGHMEQLPPYSRHPEEGPTKASLAAEASATPIEPVPNPMANSNDALLTDTAPPSPRSPVSPLASPPLTFIAPARLPQQRPETQTGSVAHPRPPTTSESASLLTSSEEVVLEKQESESIVTKDSWRSKRLWGRIPITIALIMLVLLLIFAIIIGAAIGTFLAKNKDKPTQDEYSPTKPEYPASQVSGSNNLFGATPITTPTSLPSLPTGQFSLPLGYAQEASPGCLLQGNQYRAWSCKMSFAPLQIIINNTSDGYIASLQTWVAPDGSIQYGLQAPTVITSPLQLVTDLDYRGYGPAWHFSARYDKVVVLQTEEFVAGSSLRKRDQGPDKPAFRHRFQVQPGDNPWYCIWNSTYIEGYIYAKDNSTAASMTNYPTPNPTDPFDGSEATSSSTSTTISSAVATPPPLQRDPQKRDDRGNFRFPFPYPRIVKVEERRLPGAPQPFCQKMQLLDNGQLAAASGSNGGPIIVYLQEQDPTIEDFIQSSSSSQASNGTKKRGEVEKRTDPSNACHCQWMFQ